MRTVIAFFLITALTICVLCEDNCNESTSCPADAPEVCVFDSDLICFRKYENLCMWNEVKCKYNLQFTLYAPEFCHLESFTCLDNKNKLPE